jgi:uncharacterized protein YpmB
MTTMTTTAVIVVAIVVAVVRVVKQSARPLRQEKTTRIPELIRAPGLNVVTVDKM